jgi:ribokinase
MERKVPRILVVGSINMDLVIKCDNAPDGGETVLGQSYSYIPGGKGANAAVAAARLGAEVTFAGRVGKDANGASLRANLCREGISADFIGEDETNGTGLAAITLEKTGQNRIIVIPGANMSIEKEDIHKAFERDYDAVMMQFEISREIIIETCRIAREKGIPVILDAGPAQPFPLDKLGELEIISPNETETFSLTGIKINSIEDAKTASKLLQEKSNAKLVVIKLGDKGAYLYQNGEGELFPSHKVEVVDTTAAGDAFTAALTCEYTATGDIRQAIRYANFVGALAVTKLGAQPSLPTAEEVRSFSKGLK